MTSLFHVAGVLLEFGHVNRSACFQEGEPFNQKNISTPIWAQAIDKQSPSSFINSNHLLFLPPHSLSSFLLLSICTMSFLTLLFFDDMTMLTNLKYRLLVRQVVFFALYFLTSFCYRHLFIFMKTLILFKCNVDK